MSYNILFTCIFFLRHYYEYFNSLIYTVLTLASSDHCYIYIHVIKITNSFFGIINVVILVHIRVLYIVYSYVLVYTHMYSCVLVCTRMYSYVLVCTRIVTNLQRGGYLFCISFKDWIMYINWVLKIIELNILIEYTNCD